ncbi:MAG: hypothetical protein ABSE15_04285 [Candidatus Bathyarchaeia archaeon]
MVRKSFFTLAFGVSLILILIGTASVSLAQTVANTTSSATLPPFLEKFLEALHPNATAAELNQIRIQWANQNAHNQERIKETNGAVLSFSPLALQGGMNFMGSVVHWWTDGTGVVAAPYEIVGPPDGSGTEFFTPHLNDEAFDVGLMDSSTSYGDVYLHTQLGPTWAYGPGNYVIVLASNNPWAPFGDWSYIGWKQVTVEWPNWQWLWIGYTWEYGITFSSVAVCAWNAGQNDAWNDFFVDSVVFTGG